MDIIWERQRIEVRRSEKTWAVTREDELTNSEEYWTGLVRLGKSLEVA